MGWRGTGRTFESKTSSWVNESKKSFHGSKNFIFFEFGAIVFWGFQIETENKYLNHFEAFFKYKKRESYEQDTLSFVKGENFGVFNDKIITSTDDEPLERIAISYALAQSTILSVYEDEVDKYYAVTN